MKKVFFISKNYKVNKIYSEDLKKIFEGYIELKSFSFERNQEEDVIYHIKDEITQADMTIVADEALIGDIKEHIGFGKHIDYLRFSFQETGLEMLNKIPENSKTRVCFYIFSKALQASASLYESGYTNLVFYPYGMDRNMSNIDDIDYAVTFGQIESVPKNIHNIIDLGYRKISFSNLINIALKLGILDNFIENRIIDYSYNTPFENLGIKHFYNESNKTKSQLRSIIDKIDYGVLIYDDNFEIVDMNDNFLKIFNILNHNIINKNVFSMIHNAEICNLLLMGEKIEDKLFFIENINKNILVSRNVVNEKCFIIVVKDVTEIMNLERNLRREIVKKGHVAKYTFLDIKGESEVIKNIIKKAIKIADIDKPTLILGESGTGKELFAHSIHNRSKRKNFPFVAINCAALSTSLLESELFGYEEGSFTGSKKGGKEGVFELAHNGTLFLDEICEIPLEVQAKLLRALAENEIMRVGATSIIHVNTRVIAATHKDIKSMVKEGKFRLDLYYRLNVLTVSIPSLRERKSDIPILIKNILEQDDLKLEIPENLMKILMVHEWDGNVRELKNCIEYLAYTCEEPLTIASISDYIEIAIQNDGSQDKHTDFTIEEEKLVRKILNILKRESVGRRKIIKMLENQSVIVSDHKMRKILQKLKDMKYIEFSQGREGIRLTDICCKYLDV